MNATIQLGESVAAFAAAVREQLDDLTAEQIEDLTDGLEADLAEGAVDRSGAFEPGDARDYASELRASAGLPPRQSPRISVAASIADWRAGAVRHIRSSKFGAGLLDFLLSLRPLWWVLRGWLIFTLFAKFFSHYYGVIPDNVGGQLILVGAVVISVQWGRGRWLPPRLRAMPPISNLIAAVATAILTIAALAGSFSPLPTDSSESPLSYGLWYDGRQISNIFAYDAAGQPLQFVQLYTETGEPLTVLGERVGEMSWGHYTSDGSRLVPPASEFGSTDWNVFPLYSLAPQFGLGQGKEQLPQLPFERARPLVGADALVQTCEIPPAVDETSDEQ
ncbi:MAG: hypothetical protein KF680_00595 [Cryobacterium sp.]|nr:hypothetical protein [Cryobacterium sp.]